MQKPSINPINKAVNTLNKNRLAKLQGISKANDAKAKAIADTKEKDRKNAIKLIKDFLKRAKELNTLAAEYFKASKKASYDFTIKLTDDSYHAPTMRYYDVGSHDGVDFVAGITYDEGNSNWITLGSDGQIHHQFFAGCKSSTGIGDVNKLSYGEATTFARGLVKFEQKLYSAIDSL